METLNIAATDLLLEAMDNMQLSFVIFLDMSKAFDRVRHDISLQRMLNLGVSRLKFIHGSKAIYLTDGSM